MEIFKSLREKCLIFSTNFFSDDCYIYFPRQLFLYKSVKLFELHFCKFSTKFYTKMVEGLQNFLLLIKIVWRGLISNIGARP